MARLINRLSPKRAAHAKPPKGRSAIFLSDGANLYLQCTVGKEGNITRSWVLKYELAGRRRFMGLGPLHTVGLKEAREKAKEARQQILNKIDPLAARQAAHSALLAEQARAVTFKADAEAYMKLHDDGWSPKHAEQWRGSMVKHVFPKIGSMTIGDITSADVLRVVEPMWKERTVTAGRVLDRIAVVLDYATAREHRKGDNPASSIRATLPKAAKITTVENFASVPYQQIGTVMAKLAQIETRASKALQLVVLCASRTMEVLGSRWDEIDFGSATWTIPAARMKARRDHKVPLSSSAVKLLKEMHDVRDGDLVFDIASKSNHLMRKVLAKVAPNTTVHGMRAAFKTWATEQTSYPKILAEAALAHRLGDDKTEEAYIRGTLFEKRRKLMNEWARYCSKPAVAESAEVVPIRA
jgi:integrase